MSTRNDLLPTSETGHDHTNTYVCGTLPLPDEHSLANIEPDRLSMVNTALRAIPGTVLCTFFAPIMSVKRNLFNRQRLTKRLMLASPAKAEKLYQDAIRILAKALVDTSAEVFDTPTPIDEKELASALRGKLVPQCYEPGAVLAYPGEFPEVMFVHIVLSGSVQIINYQMQNRRIGFGESSRRQYFVSNDMIRLSGALGLQPELIKLVNTGDAPSDATSDVLSTSNVSATVNRTLQRASRMMGQPTLQATRTELSRAPYVLCAQEALGFEPFRLATVTAEANAPSKGGDNFMEPRVIQTMRIRAKDLHDVLVQLALHNFGKQRASASSGGGGRHASSLMECISVARVKAIFRHYPLNEILMRQSWLLQDTPAYTIRALVTQLTPRSYFPGEVILCPHSTNRHLSFLRRGTMIIEEPPAVDPLNPGVCRCGSSITGGNVLQEVPQGASFGELSVLFGEPRQFVLRAKTPCDVWSLSRQSFAATIKRDDALRGSLLSKAAALRMRWLGEQRLTSVLAQKLRECCELFRTASDSFIRLIQERVEPVVYPPGILLTSTSARCTEMLIITHGKVASIVDGVAEYGPGSVIGEPTIVLHRWPLSLVSKSMVEGWKLTRQHLRDALERIEVLREHSGEVTGHAQQLMQSIFAPPVPPCGVDAVGRPRMPLVGPPPCGRTYFEYAEWLAGEQLKALCFKHREYVSLSDISYTSLSGKRRCARKSRFKIPEALDLPALEEPRGSLAIPGPCTTSPATKSRKNRERKRKTRYASTGSMFPFHLNPIIGRQLLANPESVKQTTPVLVETDPFMAKQRALTSAFKEKNFSGPLPHLQRMTSLLENRDKLMRVEAKQNKLNESKQERMNLIEVEGSSGLAPVHVFLRGNNPRVHITVEEAVNVGYVLQFPDTKRIQSCVSNIDSDVTLGLPQHRQRRRDMAFIPNDRHHRYCFLFAASQLGERSTEEVVLREAAVQEAESKERAQHLTTVLVAQLHDKYGQSEGQYAPQSEVEAAPPSEWKGVSMPVSSLCPNELGSSSTPMAKALGAVQKDSTNAAFLQQLHESPDHAMSKIRLKFQVGADATEENDILRSCATKGSAEGLSMGHASTENSAPKDGLLDRLRKTSIPGGAINESELAPPKLGTDSDGKLSSRSSSEGDHIMENFLKKESPMFIDGYGELSATQKRAIDATSGRGSSVSPNLGVEMDQLLLDSPAAPAASTATCAWVPQNFTMPTVSEAMTTMRRIQSDVNGLNAVAEEQRAERLQRRNAGGVTGALEVPNLTSLESQRLVDEWTTEYRSHSRDLLCPAQIPQQLLAEAGTDYLAEEFRQTRRQYVAAVRDTHDVEIWRGEVDARGRRYGKQRRVSGSLTGSKSLLAMVGATKLGLPTKPLWNPTSNLSAEEYQQWVTERDALFSSAGHRE